MPANIHTLPVAFGPAYIRPAKITRKTSEIAYRVQLTGAGSTKEITAQLATSPTRPLRAGDNVLVAGEGHTAGFIIGALDSDRLSAIGTEDGSGARIQGKGEDASITVHDRCGQTIFEYFPGKGRSVIKSSTGDLQLNAPEGNIELHAGKSIRCTGSQGVQVNAKGHGRLPDQRLLLDAEGAHLGVYQLDVAAGRGNFRIARASYTGKHVNSSVDRAKLSYGRLEIAAQRILQRSEQLFQQVKHLCQNQVGRLRTLVGGAHHIQSRRTTIIAQEDVRIDGKKINLG